MDTLIFISPFVNKFALLPVHRSIQRRCQDDQKRLAALVSTNADANKMIDLIGDYLEGSYIEKHMN